MSSAGLIALQHIRKNITKYKVYKKKILFLFTEHVLPVVPGLCSVFLLLGYK